MGEYNGSFTKHYLKFNSKKFIDSLRDNSYKVTSIDAPQGLKHNMTAKIPAFWRPGASIQSTKAVTYYSKDKYQASDETSQLGSVQISKWRYSYHKPKQATTESFLKKEAMSSDQHISSQWWWVFCRLISINLDQPKCFISRLCPHITHNNKVNS